MKNFGQKNNIFKIETIKIPEGDEVSFCPERGGIITSLKFNGIEIFCQDEENLKNIEASVRGGMPILFPNAGPIPDELKTDELKNLKQHGFARDSKWAYEEIPNGFKQTLKSDSKTKELYPYEFELCLTGEFKKNGSFTFSQSVLNPSENNEMPISSGFHPYFKVANQKKKDIIFNFEGGQYVKENFEKWANGQFISIQNPNVPIEVSIPDLGTLILDISKEFERIWVWSMPGKDFICIEPVMRDIGGIITGPVIIKPESTHLSSFNIILKS